MLEVAVPSAAMPPRENYIYILRYCRIVFLVLCFIVIVYVASHGLKLHCTECSPVQQNVSLLTGHGQQIIGRHDVQLPTAPQLGGYTYSNSSVFILVDLATQKPSTNNSLANCAKVINY